MWRRINHNHTLSNDVYTCMPYMLKWCMPFMYMLFAKCTS